MTPADAAQKLEQLPSATVKLKFVELLEWQAAKGKSLVNIGWYLNCLFFNQEPRPKKAFEENRRRVQSLVRRAGERVDHEA